MLIQQLQQIMENFYLCIHLPIRAFTPNGEELLSTGFLPGMMSYHKELSSWLHTKPIEDYIHAQNNLTLKPSEILLTFTPEEHIHFSLCPIALHQFSTATAKTHFEAGYYIIGPYTSAYNLKEAFLFKPIHCIPHLVELLYALRDTTLSKQIEMVGLEDYNYHIARAEKYIRVNYDKPITLEILAAHLGLNKSYLCSIFKKATKASFCHYTNKVRIEESKRYLKETNDSMLDIALAVGFSSASYFNTIFKKLEGQTPLEYRKAH